MKSHLLDSVHFFYKNDYRNTLLSLNAHFKDLQGEEVIKMDGMLNVPFEDSGEWDFFIQRHLESHWTKKVRLGLIYQEMWNHYPTSMMPWMIGRFDFTDYSIYSSRQSDEAFDALRLWELLEILRDGCQTGKIFYVTTEMPYGILPVIDAHYFESLSRDQHNGFWETKVRTAIQQGIEGRSENYLAQLPELHFEFLSRYFLKEFYLPPDEMKFMPQRFKYFHERFPERVRIISKAMHNYLDSMQDNDQLAEFLFLYTGGEILTEEPIGWFRAFIRSVEKGEVLIPI